MDFVLDNGMNAWALTDHGHMNSFSHAQSHQWELDKLGRDFKYIPGVEFYVHPDLAQWKIDHAAAQERKALNKRGLVDKSDDETGSVVENEEESKQTKWYDPVRRRHHLVVIAKSQQGLENLFALVSKSYSDGFYRFPRIDYKLLKLHSEGLIVSTACIAGPCAYDVMRHHQDLEWDKMVPGVGDKKTFEAIQSDLANTADDIVHAVGRENFFLELQFNKLGPQHLVNMHLIELAKRTNIPLIATPDSHYPSPHLWKDREMYKKLGWLSKDKYEPGILPQSLDELECELYPKNAEQMWDAYKDGKRAVKERHPNATFGFYDDQVVADAIERSYDIAHNMVGDTSPNVSVKLPSYVVPEGEDKFNVLVRAVREGLKKRGLDGKPEYLARAKEELEVIKEKDFSLYFLTMKAIMEVANNNMLVGPGRGSAAGSLVCYVLDITHVDPLKYNLLFARFLSLSRAGYPDIDSDVADNDKLKDLLRERFGTENVVPISNYNTLQLKSLVKDISKFYGIDFSETNQATKGVEREVMKATQKKGDDKNVFVLHFDDAMEQSEGFKAYIDKHPQVGEHIKVLFKQNKSIGRHAGGVIVSENIQARMPVIKIRGEIQTPWTEGLHYRHLEKFGWIKFDLLGLKTLRVIDRAIALILKRHEGITDPQFKDIKAWFDKNLDAESCDLDDQKVYENVFHDGKWAAIFQATERGMQKLMQKAKPRSIIDLAALSSIYRPGPLNAGVDKAYITDKAIVDAGGKLEYIHPVIEKVLGDTHGHMVFQEHFMVIGREFGLSWDDCDKLRKILVKKSIGQDVNTKKREQALKIKNSFKIGAMKMGLTDRQVEELWAKMEHFSGYGFNRSVTASTLINIYDSNGTYTATRAIIDMKAGEYVRSRNESTGEEIFTKVKAIHDHGMLEVIKYTFDDGSAIECTPNHKFRTTCGQMLPIKEIIKWDLDVVSTAESNTML